MFTKVGLGRVGDVRGAVNLLEQTNGQLAEENHDRHRPDVRYIHRRH